MTHPTGQRIPAPGAACHRRQRYCWGGRFFQAMGEELVEAVRAALRRVRDPAGGQDVVASGMVQGLAARDGMVQFALAVPRERAREMEPLRQAAERAAAAVPGVLSATVVLTAH